MNGTQKLPEQSNLGFRRPEFGQDLVNRTHIWLTKLETGHSLAEFSQPNSKVWLTEQWSSVDRNLTELVWNSVFSQYKFG